MVEKIDGECVIPPGYQELTCSIEEVDIKTLRFSFGDHIAFIFDPENSEYLQFLQQCREDTKKLNKALDEELKRRNIPVWVGRGRVPAYKSHLRQMGFLIRPPFFYSSEEKKAENRMQRDNERDNFVLHFDQNHNLQLIRFWPVKECGNFEKGYLRNDFRYHFFTLLIQESLYLTQNYGNWPVMAAKIVEVMEKCKV